MQCTLYNNIKLIVVIHGGACHQGLLLFFFIKRIELGLKRDA